MTDQKISIPQIKATIDILENIIAEATVAHQHLVASIDEGEKPQKPPKEKTPIEQSHMPCKTIFLDFYFEHKKVDYIWSAKDALNLNQIISKIRSLINTSAHPEKAGTVESNFLHILKKIQKADRWIFDNLGPATINSKFNQLIAKMQKPEASDKELEDYKKELENRLSGNN